METKDEFLISINKDEIRKLKTDLQPVGKINDLRRTRHELMRLMLKKSNEIMKKEEENIKEMRRMVDHLIPKTCECADLKFDAKNYFSSFVKKQLCVCGKYKSNRAFRFNPLLKAPKQSKQEIEEEYKGMESLMNQNQNYLFVGKTNRLFPPRQTFPASCLRSSTVTGNNFVMDPLLKNLMILAFKTWTKPEKNISH